MSHTLYFQNSKHERRIIAIVQDYKEAMEKINDFMDDHNFKSYYTRMWYVKKDNETHFDVGSHSEFFIASGDITPNHDGEE